LKPTEALALIFFTAVFGNVLLQPSASTPSPTGAVGVGMGYSNGIGKSIS
jgi:IMP dehydrogenase/GMP reductase